MNSLAKLLLVAGIVVGGAACTSRLALVTLPAVSMTTASIAAGSTFTPANAEVEGQFCSGDDALVSKDSNVGLMDEVTMKVQKESGADYFTNAQYWIEGACVGLTATPVKVAAPAAVPAAAPAAAPASTP